MKVRGLLGDPCFNQHLRGLNIRAFDGDPVAGHADTGEHFIRNFPGIMAASPRVGPHGTREGATDLIDVISGHWRSLPGHSALAKRRADGLGTRHDDDLHHYLLHYSRLTLSRGSSLVFFPTIS